MSPNCRLATVDNARPEPVIQGVGAENVIRVYWAALSWNGSVRRNWAMDTEYQVARRSEFGDGPSDRDGHHTQRQDEGRDQDYGPGHHSPDDHLRDLLRPRWRPRFRPGVISRSV